MCVCAHACECTYVCVCVCVYARVHVEARGWPHIFGLGCHTSWFFAAVFLTSLELTRLTEQQTPGIYPSMPSAFTALGITSASHHVQLLSISSGNRTQGPFLYQAPY